MFTTRWGSPIEPRNFNRSFDARCAKAGVPRIRCGTPAATAHASRSPRRPPRYGDPDPTARQDHHDNEGLPQVPDVITRAALNKLRDSLAGRPPAEQNRP